MWWAGAPPAWRPKPGTIWVPGAPPPSGQIFLASVLRLPEALEKDQQPLYFQSADMAECLVGPGYNVEKLSLPYVPQVTGEEP